MSDTEKAIIRDLTKNMGDKCYIILRICINTVFPKPLQPLPINKVPTDPIKLLELGLKHIDPSTIIDDRVKNVDGSAERSLQAALYCVFNGLLPRPMLCLLEVKCSGHEQLDLMIVKGNENLVAYSFKVNNITSNDFNKALWQAVRYVDHYKMDVYLVNFYLDGHREPDVPINTPEQII
ncbi:17123_t:CDS:2 [Entrophospora sp. SA101]|nr:13749_t:CDS:2 [Entrophospora sp. SA101]CAJ0746389.1 22943_t:CDS:2 [Entrophospora sp. SA101]CAJ0751266.1 80_t:CDS:2 [Entrophospora sp. SA101]CAJ0756827.1 17123_t:CDS:2 [Entrophospora sp. SA101]CAJ0835712.1 154_t:CDS:2 [Entrophospora sp. SA101]